MKTMIVAVLNLVLLLATAIHATAADVALESRTELTELTTASLPGDKNALKRRVTLNNASVEVVELLYPPGSESGLDTHIYPCRVIYALNAGELELINTDGQSQRIVLRTGQTVFRVLDKPETHNVRNVGTTAP